MSFSSPEAYKPLKRSASAFDENAIISKRRRSSLASTLEVVHHDLFASSSSGDPRHRAKGKNTSDRYIALPTENTIPFMATPRSHSLARALGMANSRSLVFRDQHTNVIPSNDDSLHSMQKCLNKALYELPTPPSLTSASTNLQQAPEMSLSAPGMQDDFYSRPAAWSKSNVLAVATKHSVNYRNMATSSVGCIARLLSVDKPACLEWSPDSRHLALGLDWGDMRLFDINTCTLLLDIPGMSYIGGMSWNGEHLLTIAMENGGIRHHDMRVSGRNRAALQTVGHISRVCGVKWNADQRYLISGAGDGSIMLWDARACKGLDLFSDDAAVSSPSSSLPPTPNTSTPTTPTPHSSSILHRVWRSKHHTSTVKALAWCPWQSDLFASGGGTRDGTIRIWSLATRECKKVFKTRAQVSSVHFSHSCREVVSTHGYAFALPASSLSSPTQYLTPPRAHTLLVHSLTTESLTGAVTDVGHGRVSDSCMSPDGTRVMTCGADETIRVYKLFGEKVKAELNDDRDTVWGKSVIR